MESLNGIRTNIINNDAELYRMAFNTQLVWEGEGNLDYDRIKERFEDPYNRLSSEAFVRTIPDKLQSIGITEDDPYIAAKMIRKLIEEAKKDPASESAELVSLLAEMEHERWVEEKTAQGFTGPKDCTAGKDLPHAIREACEACAANGSTKLLDSNPPVHPCIVPWEHLDTVSAEMKRAMEHASKRLKKNPEELQTLLKELEKICKPKEEDPSISPLVTGSLKRDYDRYRFCVNNILDHSKPYAAQFETYEKMLVESLRKRYSDLQMQLPLELISKIRGLLFTTIEAVMERDYKQNNFDLIEKLPFILTAKTDVSLCMSLGDISNREVSNNVFFKNVASATALYAETITFLLVTDEYSQADVLRFKLKSIRQYFLMRGSHCKINVIAFDRRGNADRKWANALKNALNGAKNKGQIQGRTIITYDSIDELTQLIAQKIREEIKPDYYDGTVGLTASNWDNMLLVQQIIREAPYFEFDSANKEFHNVIGCEYLRYRRPSSFIQIEDMFALMCAQDIGFNYPDFAEDYMEYWKIFSGTAIREKNFPLCATCWNKVCAMLSSETKRTDKQSNPLMVNESHVSEDKRAAVRSEKRIIRKMLEALERHGDISGLKIRDTGAVKADVSDKAKPLFALGGNLLEYYVYFEACKTGWFDDVQTGYKFKWENEDVTNELDCVLTKDYRSIIIECKSVRRNDENYYLKLDSLVEHFGIGYRKVLIIVTDTEHNSYESYTARGKQMDIVTISTREDLSRIGEILIDIMQQ